MTRTDYQVLFTALGFTAVVMQGEKLAKAEGKLRALAFAKLIGEFCQLNVPEAFEGTGEQRSKTNVAERMADVIAGIIKETGKCQPHELKEHGFTADEIARHWPMAFSLASVQLGIEPKDS